MLNVFFNWTPELEREMSLGVAKDEKKIKNNLGVENVERKQYSKFLGPAKDEKKYSKNFGWRRKKKNSKNVGWRMSKKKTPKNFGGVNGRKKK